MICHGRHLCTSACFFARSTGPRRFYKRERCIYDAVRLAMQTFLIDIYASALNAWTARCNRSAENKTTALSKKSSICLPTHLLVHSLISDGCKVTTFHRGIKFMGVHCSPPLSISSIFFYIFLKDVFFFFFTSFNLFISRKYIYEKRLKYEK